MILLLAHPEEPVHWSSLVVPWGQPEEYSLAGVYMLDFHWEVTWRVLAIRVNHDAGAVARRQEHGQAHSEAREGAEASAGAQVPGRAGSQWCLAGSPPSGERHGHCQAS